MSNYCQTMLVVIPFVYLLQILWWSKSIIFISTHEVSEVTLVSYTYQNICIRKTLFQMSKSIKVKPYLVFVYKLSLYSLKMIYISNFHVQTYEKIFCRGVSGSQTSTLQSRLDSLFTMYDQTPVGHKGFTTLLTHK